MPFRNQRGIKHTLTQCVLLCIGKPPTQQIDLQAADEGEYQCVAESEAGTAERTITLKVQSEFCGYNNTHCHEV